MKDWNDAKEILAKTLLAQEDTKFSDCFVTEDVKDEKQFVRHMSKCIQRAIFKKLLLQTYDQERVARKIKELDKAILKLNK